MPARMNVRLECVCPCVQYLINEMKDTFSIGLMELNFLVRAVNLSMSLHVQLTFDLVKLFW